MSDINLKDVKLEYINPKSSKARRLDIHLRNNKISHHPAIIIGEDGNSYLFLPLTSNPIAKSERLKRNPEPGNKKPSYVVFRMRANKKGAFTAPLNWTLDPSDYKAIMDYANKKIK